MKNNKRSVFLSYVLRHKPESIGITLDSEGWVDVDFLIRAINENGSQGEQQWDIAQVVAIVDADEKQRYTIKGGRIRANQGHSTPTVQIAFEQATPPDVLYHGTNVSAWAQIKQDGLTPQSRLFVHLSENMDTATQVGKRRKAELVILEVAAAEMIKDGYAFQISENKVWLISTVPAKYLKELPHD